MTTEAAAPFPRAVAAGLLQAVLDKHRALDDALADKAMGFTALAERDRAAIRRLVATCLRRLGQIDALIDAFVPRRPAGLPLQALRLGLCDLLLLGTPAHAAVSASVDILPPPEKGGAKARGLVNAVLRRASQESGRASGNEAETLLMEQNAGRLNTPGWLAKRWIAAYGEAAAQAIMDAHLAEAPLDISVKPGLEAEWAEALQAEILPSGSLRRMAGGAVEQLPGFDAGVWWVQDAAASLPAKLFGPVAGKRIADLCAAPGGKTAQLLSLGAAVYAVDRSEARLQRLKRNLARLNLKAMVRTADAETWQPDVAGPDSAGPDSAGPDAALLDGVLLDAPCSATGTIRRHPDLPYLKRPADIAKLADLQRRLLLHGLSLLKPGGLLVYCVCSLEPEEGEAQLAWIKARKDCELLPVTAAELGVDVAMISADGALRSLPSHWAERGGIDGFFAMRVRKL